MNSIEKFLIKCILFVCLTFLILSGQQVLSQQNEQTPKDWYCDRRLQLNLRLGVTTEIIPYKKYQHTPETAGIEDETGSKFKTVELITFTEFDKYTGEKKERAEQIYNVKTVGKNFYEFKVGEKYLFEINSLRVDPAKKSSAVFSYVRPEGFHKTFTEAQSDLDFLKSVKNLDSFAELLGTDTGEAVSAGVVNGKATFLARPQYPQELKRTKNREAVKVLVLIDETGNTIKAKSFCAQNPDLAAASEQAALASKFSPTVLSGKPVKIKGVITYNFTF